jgi:hypothetical protein
MINLIPPSAKRGITREYWLRVISVWVCIASVTLLILSVTLIPTYVFIHSQISVYADSAEAAIAEVGKHNLSSAALIQASQHAKLLRSLNDTKPFTELITDLESLQNPNITIDRFEFMRDNTTLKPITIAGKAKTRQSLADFREALLTNPTIETVFLPISNLAQDKDISFLITVTMKESS